MTYRSVVNYQEDGLASSLAEANRQINVARKATPEALRDKFKSSIRYLHSEGKYLWVWVLK